MCEVFTIWQVRHIWRTRISMNQQFFASMYRNKVLLSICIDARRCLLLCVFDCEIKFSVAILRNDKNNGNISRSFQNTSSKWWFMSVNPRWAPEPEFVNV
jgi:hypothetical protein